MRLRCMGLALAVALALPPVAFAQVRNAALARIKLLNKKAMDEYDGLEFESAKNILTEAINVARGAGITRGATLVQTYLNLGIVYGAGLNDRVNAIKLFGEALRLDANAALDAARSTPVLEEMFKAARDNLPPPTPPGAQFRHTSVDQATVGRPLQLRAEVAADLGARRVVLFYRAGAATEFDRQEMDEERPGRYSTVIPAERVIGRVLYYYVEAQDEAGQRLSGDGNAGSPNLITLRTAAAGGSGGGGIDVPRRPRAPRRHVSISVMVGTGFGIVYGGKSEHTHPFWYKQEPDKEDFVEVGPGLAVAPLHLAPEVSWHITDRWELAAMGRLQFVNAASVPSSVSFLGLLRAKVHLGTGALRGLLSFGGGGGQVRHRIPLGDYDRGNEQLGVDGLPIPDGTPADVVDTRVAGLGALALGAGLRYMFTSHFGMIAELNLLFLVPQFAANADINAGLLVSF